MAKTPPTNTINDDDDDDAGKVASFLTKGFLASNFLLAVLQMPGDGAHIANITLANAGNPYDLSQEVKVIASEVRHALDEEAAKPEGQRKKVVLLMGEEHRSIADHMLQIAVMQELKDEKPFWGQEADNSRNDPASWMHASGTMQAPISSFFKMAARADAKVEGGFIDLVSKRGEGKTKIDDFTLDQFYFFTRETIKQYAPELTGSKEIKSVSKQGMFLRNHFMSDQSLEWAKILKTNLIMNTVGAAHAFEVEKSRDMGFNRTLSNLYLEKDARVIAVATNNTGALMQMQMATRGGNFKSIMVKHLPTTRSSLSGHDTNTNRLKVKDEWQEILKFSNAGHGQPFIPKAVVEEYVDRYSYVTVGQMMRRF